LIPRLPFGLQFRAAWRITQETFELTHHKNKFTIEPPRNWQWFS
jgi:hypothetical protein